MPNQGWRQTLVTQQAAGTLFNSYTTAKSVINPQAIIVLPAGFFDTPGRMMRFQAWGGISNIITTPGTLTFQIMFGSVIVFTSGAIQLNATAHTTLPFRFDATLTCQVVGSSTTAKFMGTGEVAGIMFTNTAAQVDGVNTSSIIQVPATAPAQGTGFDSTAAQTVDFWAGFSISNAGNGIQVAQYAVSSEN